MGFLFKVTNKKTNQLQRITQRRSPFELEDKLTAIRRATTLTPRLRARILAVAVISNS
jgi:hypothetical protein